MTPIVSVIVPVYNSEKYIERCVKSILNQTHENIEIILINDGSTDNSGALCDKLSIFHKNIKVIHYNTSSGSAGKPRNSGLKIASGNYISFIDSDDWIHPEMIKFMLAAIKLNKTEISECNLCEANEYFLNTSPGTGIEKITVEDRIVALNRIINKQRFSVCVRLYEFNLIKDIRFPENVISEDVYFTLEVFNRVKKISRIEASFYYYFCTPNSVTRKSYTLKYLDTLNSGLFLQKSIRSTETDERLLITVQSFILKTIMWHYKNLNYFPKVDPQFIYRKKLKTLIDNNYFNNINHDFYLKVARFSSVSIFATLIYFNRIRHKLFKTKQFS